MSTKHHLRKQRDYTFHISQEELVESIKIYCPLSIKQEKYLQDDVNDVIVWGGCAGAGKTELSLLMLMLGAGYDPHFIAGVCRKSKQQIKQAGSLWSSGCNYMNVLGASINKTELTWNYPIGSEVKCHHLDGNRDDYQGAQCTQFIVDEGQQCEEEDVWYLTSRLRSKSKQKHQLRITCNPLKESYLCKWLDSAGYLDEDGYPIKEMDGVTTYMVEVMGEFKWHKTQAEVKDLYGKEVADAAQKFVFYSANVYDNPWIRKNRPDYITKLANAKPLEKARLLDGCWFLAASANGFMKREMFKVVPNSEIPLDSPKARCWDLAGTKPHAGYKNPDWTRGVKGTFERNEGVFYITDMKSLRDRAALVQSLIESSAKEDGKEVYIGIPQDGGAAGKEVAVTKTSVLARKGYKSYINKARGSKLARGELFLIALQEGRVCVAEGVFDDSNWDEIEAFDGAKNSGRKDDIFDAMVDCFTLLTSNRLIPIIKASGNGGRLKMLTGRTLL